MFGKRFNLNMDEIMARYNKMMEDLDKNMSSLNKDDWKKESYESPDGNYRYTSYVKVFDLSDFDAPNSKEMSKEEYLKIKIGRAHV